ncbi:hypothetical protein FRZ06_10800 [Anoxybacterium hadale]|uniref:Uncharacterized protein n=1 Tax=Anoxybacterium hadale TaxID=3408580 RepID=A0ACD1ABG5_9FIRM|nr:hypothetical protein FRZ06_10800 [Clostridiales bacterium]
MKNKEIKVLIISDRLMDKARALAEFLSSIESFKVAGIASDGKQVMEFASNSDFDYLIIAGYLKNETNYRVIEDLRKRHKRFITVQWAMVDSLINIFCSRYKIPLKFERTLPMELFVDFLRAHRNDPLLQ